MAKIEKIEVPPLALRHCTIQEHCEGLRRIQQLPFWWYKRTSRLLGNFSLPFRDRDGHWWYQTEPGLCWAVDCFAPIPAGEARPTITKSFLGYQHVLPDESQANSHLVINAILDLANYSQDAINAKRRNSIRKGLRECELVVMTSMDESLVQGCRLAWNDLTARTGWKHAAEEDRFRESWQRLLECPGVSIVIGKERSSGEVAGFVVTKIIGATAYVDTIASRTDKLNTNVNDAVMYAFLMAARELPEVRNAHYAIRSTVEHLEKFKTGLGFVPVAFPARTVLHGPVPMLLRRFYRDKYKRMIGEFDEAGPDKAPGGADPPTPTEQ